MNPSYDAVIRDAEIYDGTGAAPVTGDVAVADGRIVAVGSAPGPARLTIDGRGRCVSPGFIDVHTHDDFAAIAIAGLSRIRTGRRRGSMRCSSMDCWQPAKERSRAPGRAACSGATPPECQ